MNFGVDFLFTEICLLVGTTLISMKNRVLIAATTNTKLLLLIVLFVIFVAAAS